MLAGQVDEEFTAFAAVPAALANRALVYAGAARGARETPCQPVAQRHLAHLGRERRRREAGEDERHTHVAL